MPFPNCRQPILDYKLHSSNGNIMNDFLIENGEFPLSKIQFLNFSFIGKFQSGFEFWIRILLLLLLNKKKESNFPMKEF